MQGHHESVIDTMVKSRRTSTMRQYGGHMKGWVKYCKVRNWCPLCAHVQDLLLFLQDFLDTGLSYSTVNLAKSSLGACVILPSQQQLGTTTDITMFMKGAFNVRPPVVRVKKIWDPSVVLSWIKSTGPVQDAPIDLLVRRLVLLILLSTGQRPQILVSLFLSRMSQDTESFTFILHNSEVKQGRPGYTPPQVLLKRFHHDKDICVFEHLSVYLARTVVLRQNIDKLLITTTKPYRAVVLNTVSRWLKTGLQQSGIDTEVFSGGSVRSAATSKAQQAGAPIDIILASAGWSKESTFTRFYSREVRPDGFQAYVMQD